MPIADRPTQKLALESGHFGFRESDSGADHKTPAKDLSLEIELTGQFPDLPDPVAFAEAVNARFAEAARFGVAALRPVVDEKASSASRMAGQHKFTQIITRAIEYSRQTNGLVGCLDDATLGMGYELDESRPEDTKHEKPADFFRQLPSELNAHLVAGFAVYPCLDYEKSQTPANACKALEHALLLGGAQQVPLDAVTLNVSGDRFYEAQHIDDAIDEYRRGLKLDPQDANLLNSLGVCLGIHHDYAGALGAFSTAMAASPDDVMPVYNYGYVQLLKKDRPAALDYFLKAHQINPNAFEPALQTGRLYLEMAQYEKANHYLQQAAALNAQSNPAQRLLGDCFRGQKKEKRAETAYRQAIRLAPHDAESISALGRLYEENNRNLEIALVLHQQSVDLKPHDGRFHCRLGHVLEKLKQPEKALEAYRQAAAQGIAVENEMARVSRLLPGAA